MPGVQRIAIVDPADDTREVLRNTLLGVESVWLEAECSRYEFFTDVISQSAPDVAVVVLDAEPEKALRVIQGLSADYPTMDIVACSSRTDGQFILQVMRSGAKEFLGLPVQLEEILGVLERLRSVRPDRDKQVSSKAYAFCGSRGGVGSTSLAVNFGCILAQNPANTVALIDLDLAMGDADVCLDIVPDYTLADIALNIDRIDLQLLKRSLSRHSTGLYLLPHPVQIERPHQPSHQPVANDVHSPDFGPVQRLSGDGFRFDAIGRRNPAGHPARRQQFAKRRANHVVAE
jgi:pilus assembly protein CpaE